MSFGFIITRHVNSVKTNKYWNHCIKLIRMFYPYKKIIIIDDNSNIDFVKSEHEYKNILVIPSAYPGCGELLPYIYFLKNKWFDNAVILHDSVFIHKKIAFHKICSPVIPMWHFNYDKENIHNILRITQGLNNSSLLISKLLENQQQILSLNKNNSFVCCFGVQSYINHNFLQKIDDKYKLTNLIHLIKNRSDRCSLERIMGLIFSIENPLLLRQKSLLGNIMKVGNWGYTFDEYESSFKKKQIIKNVVKVWTGR